MANSKWTREQLKLAFHLYCQLPFGKLDQRNREVIQLAEAIERTPSAVAMKLVNFASLDPSVRNSGRKGLEGASKLDRDIWSEFHHDWERLALEVSEIRGKLGLHTAIDSERESDSTTPDDFTGEMRTATVQQRIKQSFFRRAVLSSYQSRCCMSGVSEPNLLIASHIIPWSQNKEHRLNPSNGICLSALHDKAFDKGFISLSDDYKVLVSKKMKESKDGFIIQNISPLDGKLIELPKRFQPDRSFVQHHRTKIFIDRRGSEQ
jgi:putative restriction endonuclease